MLNLNAWIFEDKKHFLSLAGHTWVDAGATASTAVVLFSHNYFPPDRERKITNINVKKNVETTNWVKDVKPEKTDLKFCKFSVSTIMISFKIHVNSPNHKKF